jgi:hypothetical protein
MSAAIAWSANAFDGKPRIATIRPMNDIDNRL